jgi:hypothetical protein
MARHAPAVKTIAEDARDWERRYESLSGESRGGFSTRSHGEFSPSYAGDETGPF